MADKEATYKAPHVLTALLKIIEETTDMPQSGRNRDDGYPFTTADDVYSRVRAACVKNSVLFSPNIVSVTGSGTYDRVRTPIFEKLIIWDMVFESLVDGSTKSYYFESEGVDFADKAFGKAHTSGIKLFLKGVFLLAPEAKEDTVDTEDADRTSPSIKLKTPDEIDAESEAANIQAGHARADNDVKAPAPVETAREDPAQSTQTNLVGVLAKAADGLVKTAETVTEKQTVDAWPKGYDSKILKHEDWAPFRSVCEKLCRLPVDTAKQAFAEGCRQRTQFLEFASSLPNLGPIEVVTLNTAEGLFDAHGLRTSRRISKEGQRVIREALGLSEENDLPLLRDLKEHEGLRLIEHIRIHFGELAVKTEGESQEPSPETTEEPAA